MTDLFLQSGRIYDADGNLINLVGVFGDGLVPVSDEVYNPEDFAPSNGLVVAEDGRVYSLLSILRNAGGSNPVNPGGAGTYVWIRYAQKEPASNEDMAVTLGPWIGICTSMASEPPTSYTAYKWYLFKGETPTFSIGTVETLPQGDPATASITGTAEDPVLNLGLPQPDMRQAFDDLETALDRTEELEKSIEDAETTRVEHEDDRISDESNRVSAESNRASAEGQRAAGEQNRVTVESQRVAAEAVRATAEGIRVANELARQTNEGLRQQGYDRMDARIDTIITPEGDPSLAELSDIRVDAWGKTYDTAGGHVRELDKQVDGKASGNYRTTIGNPVSIHPGAGSMLGVVGDADGTVWHWGGDNVVNPVEIEIGAINTSTGSNAANIARIRTGFLPAFLDGVANLDNVRGVSSTLQRISTFVYDANKTFIGIAWSGLVKGGFFRLVYADAVSTANNITDEQLAAMRDGMRYGPTNTAHMPYAGFDETPIVAGQQISAKAYGDDTLIASAGLLTVGYNQDSLHNDQVNNWVPASATGQVVRLDGCVGHVPLDVVVETVATQKTRAASKNLFNIDAVQVIGNAGATLEKTEMGCSVTANRDSGSIGTYISLPNYHSLIGKTITLSADIVSTAASNSARLALVWLPETGYAGATAIVGITTASPAITVSIPATPPDNTKPVLGCLLYVGVSPVVTGDVATFDNIQFEIGSAATSYEPYSPPMPSPEASSPIMGMELLGMAHNNGPNLVPLKSPLLSGVTVSYISNGVRVTSTNESTTAYAAYEIPIPEGGLDWFVGKTLTLSADFVASAANRAAILPLWMNATGGSPGGSFGALTVSGGKLTCVVSERPAGATMLGIRVYANYSGGTNVAGNYVNYTNVQVEFGDAVTLHAPYHGYTKALIPPEPLYGLPGYADSWDLGRGVITRRTRLLPSSEFASSMRFYEGTFPNPEIGSVFNVYIPDSSPGVLGTTLCSILQNKLTVWGGMIGEGISDHPTNTAKYLYLLNSRTGINSTDTVAQKNEKMQQWLTANPFSIAYVLGTSTTEIIPPQGIYAFDGTNLVYVTPGGVVTVGAYQTVQYTAERQAERADAQERRIAALEAELLNR